MKAIFIGMNGSMGLETNKTYDVKVINNPTYPIWLEIKLNLKKINCPYNSLESLFLNWKFLN